VTLIARLACLFTIVLASTASASSREITLEWSSADGRVLRSESLDMAAFEALPQTTVRTETPWTSGVQTFTGVLLSALAQRGGRPVREARIVALNDYSATVPAADWKAYGILVASRHNGEPMRIREKGPFWVVYPIDGFAELDKQIYHARMVWQIKSILFIME